MSPSVLTCPHMCSRGATYLHVAPCVLTCAHVVPRIHTWPHMSLRGHTYPHVAPRVLTWQSAILRFNDLFDRDRNVSNYRDKLKIQTVPV